ncbi:hypothetical protein CA54_48240 [Symmachiella macrocystis]|uniref:Uncharacterized protein n=1 Tax=Symmachiella macrocystis TaxID=2527985 RepID=A0A5C6BCZ7_9PLAN|nr:hypothetical protein CA54_48240 [Symmachiella macrocystis]
MNLCYVPLVLFIFRAKHQGEMASLGNRNPGPSLELPCFLAIMIIILHMRSRFAWPC